MVLLITTPIMLSALQSLPSTRRRALDLPDEPAVGAPISHEQLITLGRYFREKREKRSKVRKGAGEQCYKDEQQQQQQEPRSSAESDAQGEERADGHHDDGDEGGNRAEDANEREDAKRRDDKYENEDEDEDISLSAVQDQDLTLNTLLRGTKVYVPPPPPKPKPSPEYLALKARLQAAAEADAYKKLLSSSASASPPSSSLIDKIPTNPELQTTGQTEEGDDNDDPLTPTLVINIFLSILLTGFSTFWALSNFQTPAAMAGSVALPARVLLSLFAALLVGVAEAVVYGAYVRKVADARTRERRVRERKVVIGEVSGLDRGGLGGGKGAVDANADADADIGKGEDKDGDRGDEDGSPTEIPIKSEEMIWGRGVNGGVRRRVREQWDRDRGRDDERDSDAVRKGEKKQI